MATFYVENLGCAKNQVDAETMIAVLRGQEFEPVSSPEAADFIIINTCGFLSSARKESIQVFMNIRNAYPETKIILAGCLAQRNGRELFASIPEADAVFGNKVPERIGEVLRRLAEGRRVWLCPEAGVHDGRDVDESTESTGEVGRLRRQDVTRKPVLSFPGSAYVKLSEGCDHGCSYCAIPLIRGPLRSRSMEDVLEEIETFLDSGIFELNLIAQDLAAFGSDTGALKLPELLRRISKLPGDFWIRLLYLHPDNFPPELPEIVASDHRILPYFDLPFQHASRRVLARMGRTGGREGYLRLVEAIRDKLPDSILRSTFLIGFPGENNSDFEELLRFQQQARLDWVGFFRYSREEGTPAFRLRGAFRHHLAMRGAENRIRRLEAAQRDITEGRMQRFSGRILDVLVEERIEGEDLAIGRAFLHAPEVDGNVVIHAAGVEPGSVLRCRIIGVNGIDLEGVPVKAGTGLPAGQVDEKREADSG